MHLMSGDGATYMSHDVHFDMDRARRELGFRRQYTFAQDLAEYV